MSQVLRLPDELYRLLADYAAKHQETPEEALAALVRALPAATAPTGAPTEAVTEEGTVTTDGQEPYDDPWEGFYGRFTADVPDITINHDKYLAESYLDPHDDK